MSLTSSFSNSIHLFTSSSFLLLGEKDGASSLFQTLHLPHHHHHIFNQHFKLFSSLLLLSSSHQSFLRNEKNPSNIFLPTKCSYGTLLSLFISILSTVNSSAVALAKADSHLSSLISLPPNGQPSTTNALPSRLSPLPTHFSSSPLLVLVFHWALLSQGLDFGFSKDWVSHLLVCSQVGASEIIQRASN